MKYLLVLFLVACAEEQSDPDVNVHVTRNHVDAAPCLDSAPLEPDAARPGLWWCVCEDLVVTICATDGEEAQDGLNTLCTTTWTCVRVNEPCKPSREAL